MRDADSKKKIAHFAIHMGRSGGGPWRISIEDVASNLTILDCDIGDEAFSNLLSNRRAEGEGMALYVSDRHGKRHENMTAVVLVDQQRAYRDSVLPEVYDRAEAENPGWAADREPRWNSHRMRDGKYAVTMRRWVDDKGAK